MPSSVEPVAPNVINAGHDPVAAALNRAIKLWQYPLLARAWALGVLLLVVAAVCAARAFTSLIGSQVFTTDAFMLFDGAWRMMNGQQPHRDFYSHVGVLTYAPTVVGLWLSHGTAYGFGYAQALVALVLTGWVFLLSRDRWRDVPVALLCLCALFMAAAPFAIGFPPLNLGPGMVYNRYGYVLMALLLIEGFGGSKALSTRQNSIGGFSTGVVIVVAVFMKITYGAIGLFLIAALIPWRTQSKQRWTGMATGFIISALPFLVYFHLNLAPMLRDMVLVAGAKRIPWRTYSLDGVLTDTALVVLLAFFAAMQITGKQKRAMILAGIAVALSGLVLILGNHEYTGFPLASFFSILVIDLVISGRQASLGDTSLSRVPLLLLGSIFVSASLCGGILGVTYGLYQRTIGGRTSYPLNSPVLAGFSFCADDKAYADFFNDGFALLRSESSREDGVMSLDFSNPFSYSLQRKPPLGGSTVLQYRTTFNAGHSPSPEWLIGHADLVMEPKVFSDGSLATGVPLLYEPYLKSHFQKVAETRYWMLYRSHANRH